MHLFQAIIISASLVAQTAHATSSPVRENADHRHTGSGFLLPASIGPFQRTELAETPPDGLKVAAVYHSDIVGHEMLVSVEIYPAPHLTAGAKGARAEADVCTDQSVAFDQEIEEAYKARRVEGGNIASPSPQFSGTGKRSAFQEKRAKGATSRFETYLFCYVGNEWMISYIANGPVGNDLTADLARFKDAFAWSTLTTTAMDSERRATIIVRPTQSDQLYFLRGIVIGGTAPALDRLEGIAAAKGLETDRMKEKGATIIVAAFDRKTKASAAIDLVRQIRDGSAGELELEFLLMPLGAPNGPGDERDTIVTVAADGVRGL